MATLVLAVPLRADTTLQDEHNDLPVRTALQWQTEEDAFVELAERLEAEALDVDESGLFVLNQEAAVTILGADSRLLRHFANVVVLLNQEGGQHWAKKYDVDHPLYGRRLDYLTPVAAQGAASASPVSSSFYVPLPTGVTWGMSTYAGHPDCASIFDSIDWNLCLTPNCDAGLPVLASQPGTAALRPDPDSGWGNNIIIAHGPAGCPACNPQGTGYTTRYAHLSQFSVPNGPVARGQIIGLVGSTGNSSGAHLHTERRLGGQCQFQQFVEGPGTPQSCAPCFGNPITSQNSSDHMLVSADGSNLYWRQNGRDYHVTGPALQAMESGEMTDWSFSLVNPTPSISSTPRAKLIVANRDSDGLLVRERSTSEVYLLENGRRRQFQSPEALDWMGASWFPNVIDVAPGMTTNTSFVLGTGNPIFGVGEGEGNSTVKASFRDAYTSNAGEPHCAASNPTNGWPGTSSKCLGFPISPVGVAFNSGVNGIAGKYQILGDERLGAIGEKGTINYSSLGTFAVHGAIYTKFKEIGLSGSACGFPTSNEFQSGPGRRSNFQGGFIYWEGPTTTANCGPGTGPPTVTTGAASGVGQTSATLNGTVNPNGASTTLYFDYGTTTSYGISVTYGVVGSGTTAVNRSHNLSGLTCGTTYQYRARAQNSAGTANGENQPFSTGACQPTHPTVTTVEPTNVGPYWATLNATVNSHGLQATGRFEYGQTVGYGQATTAVTFTSNGNVPIAGSIAGLLCSAVYHFRFVATSSAGTSHGNDRAFTTSACPPVPTVTTDPATAIGQLFATLNATVNSHGVNATGWIEYGPTIGYGTRTADVGFVGTLSWSETVSLSCGTTYHFRARAFNATGPAFGQDQSFTTLACLPPAVPGVNFFTLAPCRVVDTRGGAPIGGPALQAQQTRVFAMTGNCGIPSTAKALSINLAVTQASAAGNVRLFPPGPTMPLVSSVNYTAGQTRANNAVVLLDVTGALAAFAGQAAGTTVHLIIDVNGYFE